MTVSKTVIGVDYNQVTNGFIEQPMRNTNIRDAEWTVTQTHVWCLSLCIHYLHEQEEFLLSLIHI